MYLLGINSIFFFYVFRNFYINVYDVFLLLQYKRTVKFSVLDVLP